MIYSDREKLIYEPPAGGRFDPLALYRKLIAVSGGRVNDCLTAWGDPAAEPVARAAAEESLVGFSRSAFGLKPFTDDGGVLDAVALEQLFHFLDWLQGKD